MKTTLLLLACFFPCLCAGQTIPHDICGPVDPSLSGAHDITKEAAAKSFATTRVMAEKDSFDLENPHFHAALAKIEALVAKTELMRAQSALADDDRKRLNFCLSLQKVQYFEAIIREEKK
jgi:predicted lipid-binding transport protein (Tim44 family)